MSYQPACANHARWHCPSAPNSVQRGHPHAHAHPHLNPHPPAAAGAARRDGRADQRGVRRAWRVHGSHSLQLQDLRMGRREGVPAGAAGVCVLGELRRGMH